MGNFSVNHYSKLYLRKTGTELTYVMDLAEIPSFQLMGQWNIERQDHGQLADRAQSQAKEWLNSVVLEQNGQRIPFQIKSVTPIASEGAAGMPVLRILIHAEAASQPGEFTYTDGNFPGRAGWKEIVVDHDPTVVLRNSSRSNEDVSKGLTYYPTDPSVTPPQDLEARVEWSPVTPATKSQTSPIKRDLAAVAALGAPKPPPAESFSQQQPDGAGSVSRGDFLSRMLQRKEIGMGTILLGILAAFGLGALHAMSPGHGKTIVAAYLVGSRGTLKHAALLGFVVTFTHTFIVFLLGLGMLFFQRYTVPEKIFPILGSISGMSIVAIGVMLLYQRAKALLDSGAGPSHSHAGYFHAHESGEGVGPVQTRIGQLRAAESPEIVGATGPDRSGEFVHSHGGSTHSHMIEGKITPGCLIALGISGGLVPCPSALILMLSAIALGHAGLGLILLVGFSAGLAIVLMAFGILAVYARHMLPNSEEHVKAPLFRLIPIFSSVVVICLGLIMTAVSAGWFKPLRFLS